MRLSKLATIFVIALGILTPAKAVSQTLIDTPSNSFKVGGYLRTGFGTSEGGATQALFQIPGALNKYSLGNQADTYGEVEFDYTHYLTSDKSRSIDAVWMTSIYEPFGSKGNMKYNFTEQLYLRANNLFGRGESIWFGNKFYDRKAIYMLDRQWLNPGQKGWGAGIENLLDIDGSQDLKITAWQFKNRDVTSYKNGKQGDLTNYTADIRWVDKQIAEGTNINFALNFNYRLANKELGYKGADGYGAFAWVDYTAANITNTTALLYRHGANNPTDHWSGISQIENPNNDNLALRNIAKTNTWELNNNFLYDDKDNFAINAIVIIVAQDYGTAPYRYEGGEKVYLQDRGSKFYWLSAGTRAMYYVTDNFRPSLEYTYEYGNNSQLGVKGSLHKISLSPELALAKGFYSRPALRPFATYAFWSDDFKGYIGNAPAGAPYADATSGFTAGVQFEIWW